MSTPLDEPLVLQEARVVPVWQLQAIFALLGLASSVLWNQLLLCVGLLSALFGEATISRMALAQNAACALVMILITGVPWQPSRPCTTWLVVALLVSMIALAGVLIWSLQSRSLSLPLFVVLVAINGVGTGGVQILSASLSGMLSGVSSQIPLALLVGEAGSPLVTTAVASALGRGFGSEYTNAIATLLPTLLIMSVALGAALRLRALGGNEPQPAFGISAELSARGTPPRPLTLGRGLSRRDSKPFVQSRLRAMVVPAAVTCVATGVWIYLLCALPRSKRAKHHAAPYIPPAPHSVHRCTALAPHCSALHRTRTALSTTAPCSAAPHRSAPHCTASHSGANIS